MATLFENLVAETWACRLWSDFLKNGFLSRTEDQVQLALEQILGASFRRKDWVESYMTLACMAWCRVAAATCLCTTRSVRDDWIVGGDVWDRPRMDAPLKRAPLAWQYPPNLCLWQD